jgi:hypothetical protein
MPGDVRQGFSECRYELVDDPRRKSLHVPRDVQHGVEAESFLLFCHDTAELVSKVR